MNGELHTVTNKYWTFNRKCHDIDISSLWVITSNLDFEQKANISKKTDSGATSSDTQHHYSTSQEYSDEPRELTQWKSHTVDKHSQMQRAVASHSHL